MLTISISNDMQILKKISILLVYLTLVAVVSHTCMLSIISLICARTTDNGKPHSVAKYMTEGTVFVVN